MHGFTLDDFKFGFFYIGIRRNDSFWEYHIVSYYNFSPRSINLNQRFTLLDSNIRKEKSRTSNFPSQTIYATCVVNFGLTRFSSSWFSFASDSIQFWRRIFVCEHFFLRDSLSTRLGELVFAILSPSHHSSTVLIASLLLNFDVWNVKLYYLVPCLAFIESGSNWNQRNIKIIHLFSAPTWNLLLSEKTEKIEACEVHFIGLCTFRLSQTLRFMNIGDPAASKSYTTRMFEPQISRAHTVELLKIMYWLQWIKTTLKISRVKKYLGTESVNLSWKHYAKLARFQAVAIKSTLRNRNMPRIEADYIEFKQSNS